MARSSREIYIVSNNSLYADSLKKLLHKKTFSNFTFHSFSVKDFFTIKINNHHENFLLIHTESVWKPDEWLMLKKLQISIFKKIIVLDGFESNSLLPNKKSRLEFLTTHEETKLSVLQINEILNSAETLQPGDEKNPLKSLQKNFVKLHYLRLLEEKELQYIQLIKEDVANKNLPEKMNLSLPQINRLETNLAEKMHVAHSKIPILLKAAVIGLVELTGLDEEMPFLCY